MPTIHELHAQAEWEMEGIRRAIVRYEEAEREKDPMTLPPGKALVRGVIGPLIEAIKAEQDRCADALRQPGRQASHAWLIQILDPQKAAVITLNVACTHTQGVCNGAAGRASASTVPMVAKRLAACLRDQIEYDRWEAAEEQRNAEAKRSKAKDHENRLKALQLRYPSLDRRVWAKWRAKLELAREVWSEVDSIAIGTALIHLLCQAAPDRFVLSERPCNGGVQYFLDVTEGVREVMRDVRERAMVARPTLLPMICPPIPWSYEEEPS